MSKISSEVLAASISPLGFKLVTLRVTFPRVILCEFLTHREFSRNFSSNRAITVARSTSDATFVPMHWGRAQRGMQASEDQIEDLEWAREEWAEGAHSAVCRASALASEGLHKQIANRLLEPFQWVTGVVSFTSAESGSVPGGNFFAQRTSLKAEPHIYELAWAMADSVFSARYLPTSTHVPLVSMTERRDNCHTDAMMASAMRCARVSYNNLLVDGSCIEDAKACQAKLLAPGDFHGSPFEHQAALGNKSINSNFRGDWLQYRVMLTQQLARQNRLRSFGTGEYSVGRVRKIQ